jgi:hypothetical protein
MFKTHQGRLPNELAKLGITTMQAANQYLKDSYMSACNAEFSCAPREPATAFVPYM